MSDIFSAEQKRELERPLDRASVKQRDQSGRKLSYIEGWHAIAEANRIFGFGGWSRETVELKCVAEHERQIGKVNPQPGHGVSYTAKVRVNVAGVIREGCGTGHGIDRDLGQAHESALKEAETDAMKRALMTFGNAFGLALYDKTQENVIDRLPKKNARDIYLRLQAEVDKIKIRSKFDEWCAENEGRIQVLPEDWEDILRLRIQERRVDLQNLEKHEPPEGEVIWDDDTPPEWDSAWDNLGPVKQAGILCKDEAFWKFIKASDEPHAVDYVRFYCKVASRKDIRVDEQSGRLWRRLVESYRAWQREPSVIEEPASAHNPGDRAADTAAPAEAVASPAGAVEVHEDEIDRMKRIDRELDAAAALGWKPLKAVWDKVSDEDAPTFQAAMDIRHKPKAMAVERARKEAADAGA